MKVDWELTTIEKKLLLAIIILSILGIIWLSIVTNKIKQSDLFSQGLKGIIYQVWHGKKIIVDKEK